MYPRLRGGGIELDPPLPCPYCDARAVHAVLGSAPPVLAAAQDLEGFIEESRALPLPRTLQLRLFDSFVQCTRAEEGWSWEMYRRSGLDAGLLQDLETRLRALGSVLEDGQPILRGYAFFERTGR